MEHIFIDLLNISITAGYLVLAILLLRPLLRKAPKFIRCVLWGLVGLRLAFPFSVESILSLIPSAETVPPGILYSSQPSIHSGIPLMNSVVNPILSESMAPTVGNSVNPMQVVMTVGSWVWIAGMVILLLYAGISYTRLRFKLREAVYEGENTWVCDHIDSAFLLGLFRPRIFLPSALNGQDKEYVIAHERAHLGRKDHWWKPFGFLLLTVYWFNPLMWVAYILLCRDIEFACDEKVIRQLGTDCKKSYSEALINCSVSKKSISACPVAFGEEGVPGRIRSILNYKKPAFWIILIAVILCIAVAVCFLTVPQKDVQLFGARYETGQCLFSAVVSADKETDSNNLVFDIHNDGQLYKEYDEINRDYLGVLYHSPYTLDTLNNVLVSQGASSVSLDTVKESYILQDSAKKTEYVFFTHADGSITAVSFFSDGTVMSIFTLNQIDGCFYSKSNHYDTIIGYPTEVNEDKGYMSVTVTQSDSMFDNCPIKVFYAGDKSLEGQKISIAYYGIAIATSDYHAHIPNVYFVTPYLNYSYVFKGTVIEIQEDAVLVEPAEWEDARNTSDVFVVRHADPAQFRMGEQVTVYYDRIEELDPAIIPYPCTISTQVTSSDLFSTTSGFVDGQTVCDIDKDGMIEYCCVTRHPLTGLNVMAVYAYENGVLDYFDYFIPGEASEFSFRENQDGTLSILSENPERVFSLAVQGSRLIVTDEENEPLPYWGDASTEVATLQDVISKYPDFLNLSTANGLEVYVWKNGDWRCGLRSGSSQAPTLKELWAFKDGATLEEMAVILSIYSISAEDIVIGYNYHPAFSGPYGVMPSAGEQAYIKATLLQYSASPHFPPTVEYPLAIYAFDLAPNVWCFQFIENTSLMHTPFDLINYPHCNLEAALEKLKNYDIPPQQIPVVVYQNPISSYYGGGPEGKTQTVRQMLGLG